MNLRIVHESVTADKTRRWPDGSLMGVKMLVWKRGEIRSPMHPAVWHEGKLSAVLATTSTVLRGHEGIHAIWPPRDDEGGSMQELMDYAPRHRQQFLCKLRGWGDCVLADIGWRAQHAQIVEVLIPPQTKYGAFLRWCLAHNIKMRPL